MQSQYPWDLVRLGIEASLRTPLRRVPSLLTLARCPGWSKSRGRPRGRAWERSPSEAPVVFRLAPGQRVDNPVMFPPGRARLATNPLPTGSLSCAMTMGIVAVASLAARVAVGPAVTMTSTLRRTSSAASAGRRSSFSLCISPLNDNVFPLHVAKLAQTLPECLDAGRVSGRGGNR